MCSDYAEHVNIKCQISIDVLLTVFRFKDHVQNNLPRDLLTSEQFIQLRRELASVNGHAGGDVSAGDDLPSGTEDITDPAKVHMQRVFVGTSSLTLAYHCSLPHAIDRRLLSVEHALTALP